MQGRRQRRASARRSTLLVITTILGMALLGHAGTSSATNTLTPSQLAANVSSPAPGYDMVTSQGQVLDYGNAPYYGTMGNTTLNKPIAGMAATPDGRGYWLVASDGGIFTFGDAQYYGSTGGMTLNKPIVGMAATPDGKGYWLVASDGGIFTFGDAQFYGSTGAMVLNKPIVGMAATPDGRGYWLVASDGGIFTFGDAQFYGSTGAIVLNKPIVGMAATPSGGGYWLVASDGGIFTFGDAQFYGSTGAIVLNKPIVGMAATPDGKGYWLVASDGGIFTFGDAQFYGSAGSVSLPGPVVGLVVPEPSSAIAAPSLPPPNLGPPSVTTTLLPDAIVGMPYSYQLTASDGAAPYSWSATNLPEGLSLSQGGLILGTPTQVGDFDVTIVVSGVNFESTTQTIPLVSASPSPNWAGYSVLGGPFTMVEGDFNVASLLSSQPSACQVGTPGNLSSGCATSEWIGIDGANNSSLIQTGITLAPIVGTNSYAILPWWEVLPSSATIIQSMTVSPNDELFASISELSPGSWSIYLGDLTTGQYFSTNVVYNGPASSVEWIAEAPGISGSQSTLAPFSQVGFNSINGVSPSANYSSFYPIALVQGGTVLATPSPITQSGDFTINYQ